MLTVQIGKMECGQFVGKIKPDKDVERLARSLSGSLSRITVAREALVRFALDILLGGS